MKRILEKNFSDFMPRGDSGVDGKSVVDGDTEDGAESGGSGERLNQPGEREKKPSPRGGGQNDSSITINDLKTLIAIKSGKHPDAAEEDEEDEDEEDEDEDGAEKDVTDTGKETSVVVKDPRFK